MDAFLSELFDVREVDHVKFLDPVGGLSHVLMMKDERLVSNAAFRFAWMQLSGGALPSARCFAEFVLWNRLKNGVVDHNLPVSLDTMTGWMRLHSDGPFFLTRGTSLIRDRLAVLEDGRFDVYVASLRDNTPTLHRAIVEKLVDRHMVVSSARDTQLQVETCMHMSLYTMHKDLASSYSEPSSDVRMTNPASGMIASHEEERSDIEGARACGAPLRVSRGDAIKRRFSRDLHFQRRQFDRPFLTATSELSHHAEVVRMAIGAP